MQGKILDFSIQDNMGIINTEEGTRYRFQGSSWKEHTTPSRGQSVDFDIDEEGKAIDIYLIIEKSPSTIKKSPGKVSFNKQNHDQQSYPENEEEQSFDHLSSTWQFRFAFFDENGTFNNKQSGFHQNFRQLSFGEKVRINYNFFAFFFGIIYFLILGLWKKGLVLLGIGIIIQIILTIAEAPEIFSFVVNIILGSAFAITANVAYYLKERHNTQSWNPFEGIF